MVGKKLSAAVLTLLVLVLFLSLVFAGLGFAQEEYEEKKEPRITEEYRVTINDVGDGHIVDTIKYNEDDFEQIKKVMDKNPEFMTRRYRSDTNIGEVVKFNTELDEASRSIVITFDIPGYAYNMKDHWEVMGELNKPKKNSAREIEYVEQSDVNSEFTLFTTVPWKTTTTIDFPAKARNVEYQPEEKKTTYQMPGAKTLMGFWSENRTLLSIVFGILTLVFAGLLLFVYTRKTKEKPAPAMLTQAAQVSPLPAAVPGPTQPAAEGHKPKFCRSCGKELTPGKTFCSHCGTHV